MLVLDFIIANEDRHQINFGLCVMLKHLNGLLQFRFLTAVLRLVIIKLPGQILHDSRVECKMFKKNHEDQINLVSLFEWIDFKTLNGVEDDIISVLNQAGEYKDESRKSAIIKSVLRRIEHLKRLASK